MQIAIAFYVCLIAWTLFLKSHYILASYFVCDNHSSSLQSHGLCSTRLLCPCNSPDKNTGDDFLLQGILLIQGLNLGLPYRQADCLLSESPGNPPLALQKRPQSFLKKLSPKLAQINFSIVLLDLLLIKFFIDRDIDPLKT